MLPQKKPYQSGIELTNGNKEKNIYLCCDICLKLIYEIFRVLADLTSQLFTSLHTTLQPDWQSQTLSESLNLCRVQFPLPQMPCPPPPPYLVNVHVSFTAQVICDFLQEVLRDASPTPTHPPGWVAPCLWLGNILYFPS